MDKVSSLLARIRAATATAPAVRLGEGLGSGREAILHSRRLMRPKALAGLERVQEALADNGLYVSDGPIGAGSSNLVFDVRPMRSPDERHVLKLDAPYDIAGEEVIPPSFALPDIPGVAPYWLVGKEGPVRYGVQRRADHVLPTWEAGPTNKFWWERTQELADNLAARGWEWGDKHAGNIGLMPDRTWAVIDGSLHQYDPTPGFIAKWSNWATPEEAIRALRYDGPIP